MINREKLMRAFKKVLLFVVFVIVFLIIGFASLLIIDLDKSLWELLFGVNLVPPGKGGFIFSASTISMMMMEICVIALTAAVLVVRHGWWSKKLFVHIAVWYAIYMVVSMGIIIYEGIIWDLLWDFYMVIFMIENSLLPLVAIAIAAGFTGAVRLIKSLIINRQ